MIGECCDSGCDTECVMTIYYNKLQEYEEIILCTSTPSESELEDED